MSTTTRNSFGTRAEMLADLEVRIQASEIRPGEKLPSERELGVQYRISRTVVRETLSALADRGYIEIVPGRGSFARAPEPSDLSHPLERMVQGTGVTSRNMVEARQIIEVWAAGAAAQHASAEDISRLQTALAAHDRAVTLDQRVSTDVGFHAAIAKAGNNPVVEVMFGAISSFVSDIMYRSHSDPTVHLIGDPMHGAILEAIERHDPAAARAAMDRHIELALELYGDDVDQPLADVLVRRGISRGR